MAAVLPTNATINITDTKTYFDWVQEVSGGNFFPAILLGLFVIFFMILKVQYSGGKAFVGSSFICTIFALFLTALGWLAPMYLYIAIILTAIGVVWAYYGDSNE
jgi:hypothetical protein